jgi:hypothetical protein
MSEQKYSFIEYFVDFGIAATYNCSVPDHGYTMWL